MREYPHLCPCGEEISTFIQGVEHGDHVDLLPVDQAFRTGDLGPAAEEEIR